MSLCYFVLHCGCNQCCKSVDDDALCDDDGGEGKREGLVGGKEWWR